MCCSDKWTKTAILTATGAEAECARIAPRLPAQWNRSPSSHSFVYAHTQSSMHFVVRVDRMGAKIEVRGLATGDERIARFELTARDYVSSAALPLRITMTPDGAEDRSDLPQKLRTLFISEERIKGIMIVFFPPFQGPPIFSTHPPTNQPTNQPLRGCGETPDLATLLKISLIQRLVPSLHKEGYTEEPQPAQQERISPPASQPSQPPQPNMPPDPARPTPYPAPDPLAAQPPPRPPVPAGDFPPPGFEDEYEINRPPRLGPVPASGPGGFGNVGHDDLYPAGLGPHDPIRGSFTGGGMGIGPEGLRRPGGAGAGGPGTGGGGMSGMHPTFDDPLFQGPRGRGGDDGTFGGQAPPGARWDPLGPGGHPRFGGGRPGGRGGGGFGGFGSGDII